jgi:hypothetical protein
MKGGSSLDERWHNYEFFGIDCKEDRCAKKPTASVFGDTK